MESLFGRMKEMRKMKKLRDPFWKFRRLLGHKIVRNKKRYSRKVKHAEKI